MNTAQTVEVDLYSDGSLAGDADWTVRDLAAAARRYLRQ
jgi:hypothetical protein